MDVLAALDDGDVVAEVKEVEGGGSWSRSDVQVSYCSLAIRTTALRVRSLSRNPKRWRSLISGINAGTNPRRLASGKIPSVPVSEIPSISAWRLAKASSKITTGSVRSRAKSRTPVSPGPRSATKRMTCSFAGTDRSTHGNLSGTGRSRPRRLPSASSSATAVGTTTREASAGSSPSCPIW